MAGRVAYLGNIVTNGLILDLDAAKRESYPGTGTSWNDISNKSKNFNIISSSYTYPSFDLNGTGSYFASYVSNALFPQSAFTAEWFFKPATGSGGMGLWVEELQITITPSTVTRRWYNNNTTAIANSENFGTDYSNQWIHLVWQVGSLADSVFLNGNQVGINRNTTISNPTITGFNGVTSTSFIGRDETANYLSGSLGVFRFYNRVLTQAEVTQNFNAYRSRYGI